MSDRRALAAMLVLITVAAALLVAGEISTPAEAQRREVVPPSREVVSYTFAPIVRKAAPAVVNVYVQRRVQTFVSPFANDPIFRRFFGQGNEEAPERVQRSLGSGVIVSPDGTVVTNAHVIKGRGEAEIRISLSDKREFDATVVSQDDRMDIAILKIEGGDGRFPAIEIENSDILEVGDLVLAIGNPFGVGQTVTSGIVSALARSEIGQSDAQVFIQTDAAINPGNSGGALVDMSGKLVGINTMIFSQSGGSEGIGFAIPSNLVRVYVESAATGRKVERPWLGAKLELVTRETAESLGLERPFGALVSRVGTKSPAVAAGLEPGDVIVKVDGFETGDPRAVLYRLTTRGVGNTARLEVVRKGRPVSLEIAVQAAPKPGRDDVRNLAGKHPLDGARVALLGPGMSEELGIDEDGGVAVLSVRGGSVAGRLGFRPGDIILAVNGEKIDTLKALDQALVERQRLWTVSVKRGEQVLELRVPG